MTRQLWKFKVNVKYDFMFCNGKRSKVSKDKRYSVIPHLDTTFGRTDKAVPRNVEGGGETEIRGDLGRSHGLIV